MPCLLASLPSPPSALLCCLSGAVQVVTLFLFQLFEVPPGWQHNSRVNVHINAVEPHGWLHGSVMLLCLWCPHGWQHAHTTWWQRLISASFMSTQSGCSTLDGSTLSDRVVTICHATACPATRLALRVDAAVGYPVDAGSHSASGHLYTEAQGGPNKS